MHSAATGIKHQPVDALAGVPSNHVIKIWRIILDTDYLIIDHSAPIDLEALANENGPRETDRRMLWENIGAVRDEFPQ